MGYTRPIHLKQALWLGYTRPIQLNQALYTSSIPQTISLQPRAGEEQAIRHSPTRCFAYLVALYFVMPMRLSAVCMHMRWSGQGRAGYTALCATRGG